MASSSTPASAHDKLSELAQLHTEIAAESKATADKIKLTAEKQEAAARLLGSVAGENVLDTSAAQEPAWLAAFEERLVDRIKSIALEEQAGQPDRLTDAFHAYSRMYRRLDKVVEHSWVSSRIHNLKSTSETSFLLPLYRRPPLPRGLTLTTPVPPLLPPPDKFPQFFEDALGLCESDVDYLIAAYDLDVDGTFDQRKERLLKFIGVRTRRISFANPVVVQHMG